MFDKLNNSYDLKLWWYVACITLLRIDHDHDLRVTHLSQKMLASSSQVIMCW